MKILLIFPPFNYTSCPPLGIAILKHHLIKHGIDAEVLDSNIRLFRLFFNQSPNEGKNRSKKISDWISGSNHFRLCMANLLFGTAEINHEQKTDAIVIRQLVDNEIDTILSANFNIVGFSVTSSNLLTSLYMAEKIKQKAPATVITFGGPYVAGEVGQSLLSAFDYIDTIIQGEGETGLLNLVKIYPLLNERQLIQRDKKLIHYDWCADFSSFDMELYQERDFKDFSLSPTVPILTSRGCHWGKCVFCSDNYLMPRYVPRDIGRVVNEMIKHSDDFNTVSFIINDLALNGDPQHAYTFCETLRKHKKKFVWEAMIRPQTMTQDLMQTMRNAGCKGIFAGVEGLGKNILRYMNKGCGPEQNKSVIEWAISADIIPKFNFICLHPRETVRDIIETKNYLMQNHKYLKGKSEIRLSNYIPLYGSTIYNRLTSYNLELTQPLYHKGVPADILNKLKWHEYDWRPTNAKDLEDIKQRSKLWVEVEEIANDITNYKEKNEKKFIFDSHTFMQFYFETDKGGAQLATIKDPLYQKVIRACKTSVDENALHPMGEECTPDSIPKSLKELRNLGILKKIDNCWQTDGIWF